MTEGALTGWLDAVDASPGLRWAVDTLFEPVLVVLAVVVVAWLVVRLSLRALDRAVERVRAPGADASGPRRRFGDDGAAPASPRRLQRAEALAALARSAVRAVVWTLALLVALGTLGLDLGPLVAGAGVVGVALGFGAQHVVRDLLAGVSMLVEDQFGVGDVIDVGDAVGVVEGVSLRSTRVRDLRGTLWHVPNGEIRRVGNMTQGWSRAVLDLEVAYGADLDRALAILGEVGAALASDPAFGPALADAPEVVGVEALAADAVTVRLTVRTAPGEQWRVMRELRRRAKRAFDAEAIDVPFPTRTVWLRGDGAPARDGDD